MTPYIKKLLLLTTVFTMVIFGFIAGQTTVNANNNENEKVTICHANENDTWLKITVSINAIEAHFDNPGTPLFGHEDDLFLDEDEDCPKPEETLGSINVCKIIIDEDGKIVDGSGMDGTFGISGLDINNSAGVLPTSTFTTSLTLNTNIFGDASNDAQCILYDELELGGYFYGEENINDSEDFEEPLYNDQYNTPVGDLDDFFSYSGELFNNDAGDDGERNINSDGHIVLSESRPNRTLVVLNEFKEIETPYAPYCGDGEVNQTWEQCDGGNSCTAQCQSTNPEQCTEIAFARVNVDDVENWGTGSATSDIFLGSSTNRIPASAWFLLHMNGVYEDDDDMTTAPYEDVDGIAVERSEGQIRTLLFGSLNQQGGPNKEHVDGNIEFFGATVNSQTSDDSGNNKLENGFDELTSYNPGQDEVWFEDNNDTQSFFWLTVTVQDDGFFTTYEEDLMCEVENNIPIITLIGSSTVNIDLGDSYTDLGATALDFEDGDITIDILTVGTSTVDTNAEGTYTITYDVTDSDGADAVQVTRDVVITDPTTPPQCSDEKDNDFDGFTDIEDSACHTDGNPDNPSSYDGDIDDENSKPIITLIGSSTISIELNTNYTDDGAYADDEEDGNNISVIGVGTVSTSTVGIYTITYNFTDSDGLSADEVTRTVNVIDSSNPPQCSDKEDNDGDQFVDSADPGCHEDDDPENPYNPEDDDENVKPFITLIGSSTINLNINDTYTEENADVDDLEDGDIDYKLVVAGDIVDTSTVNTFIVTYNATDTQDVAADEVTRTVIVTDPSTPPQCSDTDDNDGDELVDSADPGCHEDDDPENPYNPEDDDENSKPVITLTGDNPVNLFVGNSYTDLGATANDLEDGDITIDIVTVGTTTVDTNTQGSYTITYDVTDSDGADAVQVTRDVIVSIEQPPVCTSNCGGGGGGGGGPRPQALLIFDEKLQIVSEGIALVTWKTNKPSDSRVVYDIVSHTVQTNSLHPNFINQSIDYVFTTETDDELVTEHSMLLTILDTESFYFFRPISEDSTRAIGIELDSILGDIAQCSQYLFGFIRQGDVNDRDEVIKLQIFLRDFEGFESLEITGIYDDGTYNAVVAFQTKYGGDVLSPWGLNSDTGYVYLTTRKKVNEIYCNNQLAFPLTDEQQQEVNSFRILIQGLQDSGQPLPDTSNVGFVPTSNSLTDIVLAIPTEPEEEQNNEQENNTESLAVSIGAVENNNGIVGRFFGRIGGFIKSILRR